MEMVDPTRGQDFGVVVRREAPWSVEDGGADEVVELGGVVELALGSKRKKGREDKRYFYK
ncbi:hypothetical protein [Myceligenerans indicum]|uniref:Uncharacterized protein n=1 Tax=Myceligenerans indicum TaxID=2593663 RepID=A0ABS1LJG4_9MICO|nr:hypothetical protein [Myceligenerans indicum]MBL0886380.1 hypothetical protein [Myceligenerans indicum]